MPCLLHLLIIGVLLVTAVYGCTNKSCASRKDIVRSAAPVDPLLNPPPSIEPKVLTATISRVTPSSSGHGTKPSEPKQWMHEKGSKLFSPRKTRSPESFVCFSHELPRALRRILLKQHQQLSLVDPPKEKIEMIADPAMPESSVLHPKLHSPKDLQIGSALTYADLPVCPPETFVILKPFMNGSSSVTYLARHTETGKLAIRKDVLVETMDEFEIQQKMSAVAPRIYCIEFDRSDHYYKWQRTLPKPYQKETWAHTSGKNLLVSVYMEYCCGGDMLKLNASPDRDSLKAHLLEAHKIVNYVHSTGYLHLDIKPENFVLDCAKRVRIIDFGMSVGKAEGLRLRERRGTIPYMSPEMRDGGIIDVASDYYSFGVMMYTLLESPKFKARKLVFRHTSPKLVTLIKKLVSERRI